MPRNIPLKPTKKLLDKQSKQSPEKKKKDNLSRISPYDIILGKIDMEYNQIPDFIEILKDYQKECEKEARYLEAEMAKHRINDLKQYMYEFKKEILNNYHLKEKCEIEEAYVEEFKQFNIFWDEKIKEFEMKTVQITQEFSQKQIDKKERFLSKLGKDEKIKRNCITNDVLNLQKIEVTLAKQKQYIEAQNTRIRWQQLIKENYEQLKNKAEQERIVRIEDFEKSQVKEEEDFKIKIEQLREDQIKIRKAELEKLISKYDKLKKDLQNVHTSENKAVEKDLPIVLHDGVVMNQDTKAQASSISLNDKKRYLMQKINRLDRYRKV